VVFVDVISILEILGVAQKTGPIQMPGSKINTKPGFSIAKISHRGTEYTENLN